MVGEQDQEMFLACECGHVKALHIASTRPPHCAECSCKRWVRSTKPEDTAVEEECEQLYAFMDRAGTPPKEKVLALLHMFEIVTPYVGNVPIGSSIISQFLGLPNELVESMLTDLKDEGLIVQLENK